MYANRLALFAVMLSCSVGLAQGAKSRDAIKKVDAFFEPAEARPGQTVTLKIVVQLAEGYYTYPSEQPAPEARFSTNKFIFAAGGPVIFVGDLVDPVLPKPKPIEDYEIMTYPGGGTWLRKGVVRPGQTAGATSAKVQLKLMVCDEDNCLPPKSIDLEAKLKILDGPAVEVEPRYRDAVEKALRK